MQLEVKELLELLEYIEESKEDGEKLDGVYHALSEIRYDLRTIKERMKIREDRSL